MQFHSDTVFKRPAWWWRRLLDADFPAPWRAVGQAALALAVGLLLARVLPIDEALLPRHDAQMRWWAPSPPAAAARVVDVDEATVRRFGGWPLRRDAYVPAARWLRQQGVQALVFAMLLEDARDGDAGFDAWLGEAAASTAPLPVVLAARTFASDPAEPLPRQGAPTGCRPAMVPGWRLPLWAQRAPSGQPPRLPVGQVGALSLPVSADQMLRQWPLWQSADGLALPSLPLAVWLALHPGDRGTHFCAAGSAARAWPGPPSGDKVWPVLARAGEIAPAIPLWRVLDAAAGRLPATERAELAASLRGRVVFIGSSAALGDAVLTAQGVLPTTVLTAATYDALAHRQLFVPAQPRVNALLLAVGLLPLVLGMLRRRPRPATEVAAIVAAAALLWLLDAALVAGGWQQAWLGAPLATLLAWTLAVLGMARLRALHERRRALLARAAAEAASQAKSEFLAHVGHELRTPLSALLGAADLLAQTRLDAAQTHYVGLFRAAGQELLQMLNDLLDLSKIEAGLLLLQRAPFALAPLVAHQVLLFEARAQQKNLRLLVDADRELPEVVLGDAARLAQVLRNLLSNAVKFTSVGGVTLKVMSGEQPNWLRFEVRDTGIGVPPERAEAIFTPFTQADASVAQRFGGTGLGLAIARQLVQAMEGSIGVDSRVGQGSVFHFSLPLPAAQGGAALDSSAGADAAARADWVPLAPSRLLLADDNPLNIVLAEAYLADCGHHLDIAHDGAQALRRFEQQPYPVVLLDLNMPVMGGLEAARAMRALERDRNLPPALLVAVTGQNDLPAVAAAHSAGFDLHLAKPYSREQLLQALAHRRDACAAPSAPASTAPDLATPPVSPARPVPPVPPAPPAPITVPPAPPAPTPAAAAAVDQRQAALRRLADSRLDEALERLGSSALYDRVLDAAIPAFDSFAQRFERALHAQPADPASARRLVHDLASVAATLGLSGLTSAARQLEASLADDAPAAAAVDDASAMRAALDATLQRLQALRLALHDAGPTETAPTQDAQQAGADLLR